ncbi:MAG: hypothetical protein K6V97_14805 [Actinomycetia bacterium]|nr:hypothetical protein [Actinomycetes bacterium]
MTGGTEEDRQRELARWLEDATAVMAANDEARVVRLELLDHYQELRRAWEADGWEPSEAHRAALARMGAAAAIKRVWTQRVGVRDVLPGTLALLALALQVLNAGGWRPGLYLSWLVVVTGLVSGGSRVKRALADIVAYWRGQWSKLPPLLCGMGGVVGFLVGFEPIWAGRYLDVWLPVWPVPVGGAILVALTWATWDGVHRAHARPWAAAGQVAGGFSLGLLVGAGLGLAAALAWLRHFVAPPQPGRIGYLPHWPWDAVGFTVTDRMAPVLVLLIAWVMAVATWAGSHRQRISGAASARPVRD